METVSNFLYGVSASILFSLFDYFGFNMSLKKNWADFNLFNKYRFVQGIVQLILTIFLLILSGWKSAVIFNLIWWTWGCDFLFYLYCEIFNYGNDRGNFRKEVIDNKVQWAWWTPYGLMFTKRGDVIKFKILLLQTIIGLALSVLIAVL